MVSDHMLCKMLFVNTKYTIQTPVDLLKVADVIII